MKQLTSLVATIPRSNNTTKRQLHAWCVVLLLCVSCTMFMDLSVYIRVCIVPCVCVSRPVPLSLSDFVSVWCVSSLTFGFCFRVVCVSCNLIGVLDCLYLRLRYTHDNAATESTTLPFPQIIGKAGTSLSARPVGITPIRHSRL